ncbi:16S rRNA (adenine(1518)-N(6)/adenine(1519)-N(6))-dimethyltransferase RsmA [Oribacterium sp. WCC10]|uniref:16S rRNA (adenine(1518)-N(6)/adenine(1519)-N(6))- dimethyltransferase RsmA n=1 Tax=Oribacterium sp. WCC10 TaxID=1855343 RepID=UPI0008F268CA|nr:16S rRNA (adenine(1518)-N(6)/adenine(1519)-N(6))-dimethyltransferase RsmA [Oribacterium sp. WCC10]SFG72153.1 16S rRNA (adenine1518-N6/adenine1519-N6)-dimethyltransferase [Oribacterium sp. WCC10]
MSKLINPQETIRIIQKNDFKFQKRFGQNFLIDEGVLLNIITSSEITKSDCVLEIGPGIGTMTQALAEAAGHVIAVEIDANLIPILNETLKDYTNVTIIHSDVLKLDLNDIINTYNDGKPIKVVANLPYYITTPIIMGLFESNAPLYSITVMVQKEVADRMQAVPGTKDYGALSLAVQYYSNPEIVQLVPPNCFIPRPNVGSAVIRLTRHSVPPVNVSDDKWLFKIIKSAFGQRRKTLLNSLSSGAGIPKDATLEVLHKMDLSETIRGEALSLMEFATLSDNLISFNINN